MALRAHDASHADEPLTGTAAVDPRGHLLLPPAIWQALGIEPGTQISYVVAGHHLIIGPPGPEPPEALDEHAIADILDELPAVRDEVLRDLYGDALVDQLAHSFDSRPLYPHAVQL